MSVSPLSLLRPTILILLLAAPFAAASEEAYTASDIKMKIVGKRVYLATPMGGEFPLNYRKSGVVDGSGEALGLGRFVKPEDSGRWWISGNRLCQQFKTWYKGEPMCFELYKTGDNSLKWIRNNGQTGTARIGETI
ncbi:hypothetical protein [Rhizobium oryzicola]|uniref:DUF995 domain-containing protein n=1 Tax=Rhizobium oryzicola TaxID=1232668 RepID=A0ABT8SSN9_9HYPH|nr:hypothetical protein [Rhizobium oryzicola]MDO1581399.1 hypothetical protein [Rhizobium oryzicola]